ncbi:hypothetical protein VYU27_010805, partial [Nannochloropsis oceanica]
VVEHVVQLQERQTHVGKQLHSEGLRLFKELHESTTSFQSAHHHLTRALTKRDAFAAKLTAAAAAASEGGTSPPPPLPPLVLPPASSAASHLRQQQQQQQQQKQQQQHPPSLPPSLPPSPHSDNAAAARMWESPEGKKLIRKVQVGREGGREGGRGRDPQERSEVA